jgi:hypothetical protein
MGFSCLFPTSSRFGIGEKPPQSLFKPFQLAGSRLALPDCHYRPAESTELCPNSTITRFVLLELAKPICPICFWDRFSSSTTMTMPKTSMNKNHDMSLLENKVGCSSEAAVVHLKGNPHAMNQSMNTLFWFRVQPPNSLHAYTATLKCQNVRAAGSWRIAAAKVPSASEGMPFTAAIRFLFHSCNDGVAI